MLFGRWGEISESLHNLVHDLASARLQRAGMLPEYQVDIFGKRGKQISQQGMLALLTGSIRRRMSLVAVLSQARLVSSRMEGLVGVWGVAAAKRRAAAVATQRVM